MYVNSHMQFYLNHNNKKNVLNQGLTIMVRKTKEDAELTRQRIIDAAREVFLTNGVSRTTLEQIARHAGVTRGAVYWHFNNKSELFFAMREQVYLPMIDRMDDTLLQEDTNDALACIERFLTETIQVLSENNESRQIYEIMMIKCEYVDDFSHVLRAILVNCSIIYEKLELTYQRAKTQNLLHDASDPSTLAKDTHLFFSGLLHMWVKDIDCTIYKNNATSLIQSHIAIRRKPK
jgi:TetR/AcrR family transcriptional regulator, acrAB operon repressor